MWWVFDALIEVFFFFKWYKIINLGRLNVSNIGETNPVEVNREGSGFLVNGRVVQANFKG